MSYDESIPVSELINRQKLFADALKIAGIEHAVIHHPVDLHYLCGGRQNAMFWIPATGSSGSEEEGGKGPIQWVRRSLSRAIIEAGKDDAPHEVQPHPRLSVIDESIAERGTSVMPAMQLGVIPHRFVSRLQKTMAKSLSGKIQDVNPILHKIRETKSDWEINQMKEAAEIQHTMFETVSETFQEGDTELGIAGIAEWVSRVSGFGGQVHCRRYPMSCDRAVVVSGRSGGIPSFFDAAVGGLGPHPGEGMGSSNKKIQRNEPVLVDLLHAHLGYIVDMTRMFVHGSLSKEWEERLEMTQEIEQIVVSSLDKGENCSEAWRKGLACSVEMGINSHLMGQFPDQSRFLGHSVGLELDESPVVAEGFDSPLPIGGVMAIEPKLVYDDGAIGIEDTWVRTKDGLEPISHRDDFPALIEW